jgi:two-component system, LytTR family, response regulator
MKILIVDDEKLASSRVERILKELGFEEITVLNDSVEAQQLIKTDKFDLVFLDIQMPNITGIELANSIIEYSPNTFVIFQTAYEEYAIEAFQSGGIDYILKPTTKENIEKAIEKVQKYIKTTPKLNNKKIMGKRGNKIYLIDLEDIYYIKADLDEIIVRISDGEIYVKKKIGQMATLLEGKNFFRIHRSIIVNVDRIKSMQSVEQSKLEISFQGVDTTVTSSKDGAKEFREYLEQQSL